MIMINTSTSTTNKRFGGRAFTYFRGWSWLAACARESARRQRHSL